MIAQKTLITKLKKEEHNAIEWRNCFGIADEKWLWKPLTVLSDDKSDILTLL
jgi:hypothetical protein